MKFLGMKFWKKKPRTAKPAQPDDGELIAYLDGQLAEDRKAEIERLIEESWELRVRLTELERDIEAYITATADLAPVNIPPFEEAFKQAWRDINSSAEASSQLRQGWLARLSTPRFAAGLTACLLVIVCALFYLIRPGGVPAVSASELLAQTEQAEAERMRRVREPVIHRKFQARRRATTREAGLSIAWEIWHDAGNQRVKRRVENSTGAPSVLDELEQVFQSNRMDAQRPLSAGVYQAWRQSIRAQSEEVSEIKLPDGAGALKLTTKVAGPVEVNAIIEAELVVRAEDWHPVKQTLQVRGEQEARHYELIETAFEVLALNALSPSIFADSVTPAASGAPIAPLVSASPSPTPTAASAAELMAAEIEAHYALHHARACLEPFEVSRATSGHVEVRGVVETKQRKDELLAALNANPLVTPKIQTVEEAASAARPRRGSGRRQAPDLLSEPVGAQIKAGRLPIQTYLERHFGAGSDENRRTNVARQIAELSNASVSLSEAALSEAWALRRLAERYGSRGPDELPASSRRLLEDMARDHSARLKAHVRGLRLRLEPVFSSLVEGREGAGAPSPQNPQGAGWPAQSLLIFGAVEQIDHLTSGLFAGTDLPDGDSGETAARDLLAALRRLEGRLESLLSVISQ